VKKKDQSLSEWLAAFLEAELARWDDYDDYADDQTDDYYDPEDELDSDILESLVILALTGALALLLYVRAQRQRRAEEERRRVEEQQRAFNGQGGQVAPQQQQDRGVFPNPGEPEFMNWVAGGVGH
jgi:SEL1 protein